MPKPIIATDEPQNSQATRRSAEHGCVTIFCKALREMIERLRSDNCDPAKEAAEIERWLRTS